MTEIMIVALSVMFFMVIIQTFFYMKIPVKSMIRFPIMSITTSFSMIITPMLMIYEIPATPYLQLFFIIYQVFLFFFSTMEYLKYKRG